MGGGHGDRLSAETSTQSNQKCMTQAATVGRQRAVHKAVRGRLVTTPWVMAGGAVREANPARYRAAPAT